MHGAQLFLMNEKWIVSVSEKSSLLKSVECTFPPFRPIDFYLRWRDPSLNPAKV